MSIGLRFLLQFYKQQWITTVAHTATLVLLPILTYVITNVIAGNIALSLGMVGALSIVRFRNPVRSPLELSVYFCAITMGIAASVNLYWLALLGISILCAVFALSIIHLFSLKILNKPFFNASFTEGNDLSTLEITSQKKILILEDSKFLTLKRQSNKNLHYILASNYAEDLDKILNSLENDQNILDYELKK